MTLCCHHQLLTKEWYSREHITEQQDMDNFLFTTAEYNYISFFLYSFQW